jgi:hypothetical protein
VAYDEELADRIRELVAGESGLTEKKMFGGLAFLIGGNMAVAASGQGGFFGSGGAGAVRQARGDHQRSAHGDARAVNAGVATSRRGRRSHQTSARQVGRTWHHICRLATRETIDPRIRAPFLRSVAQDDSQLLLQLSLEAVATRDDVQQLEQPYCIRA